MKITNFIKSRGIYIFLIFLLSLVFSLLIPNTLLSVISFLLSFSLSFYSLFSYQKKVISLEKEISAYSFFSSFLNSLLSQIGTKQMLCSIFFLIRKRSLLNLSKRIQALFLSILFSLILKRF